MRSHTRLPRSPGHRPLRAPGIPGVLALAIGIAVAVPLAACSTDSPASEGPNTVAYRSMTQTTAANTELPAVPTSDLPVVSPSVPATGDHPPAGTTFHGEGIGGDAAEQLQQSADAGHQPWRLDEDAVARAFVSGRFGWSQPTITHDGPYLAVAIGPNGQRVSLQLSQPARKNTGGVWVVESGLWL